MDDIARASLAKLMQGREPIPTVNAQDVKAVWELHQEVMKRHPGKQVGIGMALGEWSSEILKTTIEPAV